MHCAGVDVRNEVVDDAAKLLRGRNATRERDALGEGTNVDDLVRGRVRRCATRHVALPGHVTQPSEESVLWMPGKRTGGALRRLL
jgi:hypothetical protein